MKNILVIGSNSFSGANFIAYALARGYKVTGISRSPEKNKVMLPYKWKSTKNFVFFQLNIVNDIIEIDKLIKEEQFTMIFNFAAQSMVGESWDKPQDWMQTNVVASALFLTKLREYDFLKKYVHITTPEVYGSTDDWQTETFSFNPSTPYAVSRAASDMLFKIYEKEYNIPIVFTRAANVYGPGQQLYRIIPLTIFNLLSGKKISLHGGGQSTRAFVHMDDVSHATMLVSEHGEHGQTYHISPQELISISDLVKKICSKLNLSYAQHTKITEDRIGKDSSYKLDSNKIRDSFSWREKITLDEGIDDTIAWVNANFDKLKKEPSTYVHKT